MMKGKKARSNMGDEITVSCLEHPKSASFAEPCLQCSLGKMIRIFAHLISPIHVHNTYTSNDYKSGNLLCKIPIW